MKKATVGVDPEIAAIAAVHKALEKLNPDAQARVIAYVAKKLNIEVLTEEAKPGPARPSGEPPAETKSGRDREDTTGIDDGLEGISPVARRWISRNGINPKPLSSLFSLGGDEIDLIANEVPGSSKKERMHSVFLLKGIAAYLGSGAARFTHQQAKESCLHYDAYDSTNFAAYLKSFSSDVSGDKSTGYALTARGLARATESVKGILNSAKGA